MNVMPFVGYEYVAVHEFGVFPVFIRPVSITVHDRRHCSSNTSRFGIMPYLSQTPKAG